MRRTVFLVGVVAAVVVALPRAAVRRLRRGPTLPSWTWGEELFVAGFRAFSTRSARDLEMLSPRSDGPRMSLGRTRRGALDVDEVHLGGIRAERYRPKGPASGTIVYLHGGGFVTGTIGIERQLAAEQAMVSNCETYNVAYRLAPRHPFPAALDDAVAAYQAVLDRGADPGTTILFGGSAGAALALATLVQIRDQGLARPAGGVLLSPFADFTFSGDSVAANSNVDMLPLRDLASIWGPAYVGDADPADPLVSPALAELDGLPPLLILAGGAETLLSCAERIATNARRAGVDTQFTVYPEKVHGWMLLSKLSASVAAVAEVNAWIDARLGATAPDARDGTMT
jgi:monoterpene epsilon-lactone hydrolase